MQHLNRCIYVRGELVDVPLAYSDGDCKHFFLKGVRKYTWVALTIPGWPTQVLSLCGKHLILHLVSFYSIMFASHYVSRWAKFEPCVQFGDILALMRMPYCKYAG